MSWGSNPPDFKGDNLPVEYVAWDNVQDFNKKLNEKESLNKYRLPSEAEWEYAARAGTTTIYFFGDNGSMLGDYAWYDANSPSVPHGVGLKKPNPWELYDMYGNVWEYVQDKWHSNYNGALTDGSSWESVDGSARVLQVIRGGGWVGGSWGSSARYYRSAIRGNLELSYRRGSDFGLRLLRIL